MLRVRRSTFRLAIFFAPEAIGFGMLGTERVDAEGMAEEMLLLAAASQDFTESRKGICCAAESAGNARRSVEARIADVAF